MITATWVKHIAFLSTPIFTHSVFCFLCWSPKSSSIISFLFRNFLQPFFKGRSLVTNASWLFFTENASYFPALLKATFTAHVIHHWQLWSFSVCRCCPLLQASVIQARYLLSPELLLFYRYHIISFGLKKFLIAFSYHKFDYHCSQRFLLIYPC